MPTQGVKVYVLDDEDDSIRRNQIMRFLTVRLLGGCSIAVLAGLVLSGCSSLQGATSALQPAALLAAGARAPVYRIGNRAKVKVVVFGEDQLGGEFAVDAAGRFSMPLIGQVEANGLTARELEQTITSMLKGRYLVDPKVTVVVQNYTPFYMAGEVKNIGEHPFKEGLTIASALAMGGGYTKRGSSSYVYITRAGTTGEKEFPTASNTWIYPGDTVRIAERYF